MKRWVAYVMLAAAIAAGALIGMAQSAAAPEAPPGGSTIRIEYAGTVGSGVHIGDGYIVTAAHVVDSQAEVRVVTDIGRNVAGAVLWVNKSFDIALVRVAADEPLEASPLLCATLREGEAVQMVGNPFGVSFVHSWGRIAGKPREVHDTKLAYLVDGMVGPGMSGGPMLSNRGAVIGIVVAVFRGAPLAIVVPSTVVCELMGRV